MVKGYQSSTLTSLVNELYPLRYLAAIKNAKNCHMQAKNPKIYLKIHSNFLTMLIFLVCRKVSDLDILNTELLRYVILNVI